MSVGCDDVDAPFLKEAFTQVACSSAEGAGQRARSDLRPHAPANQPLDQGVLSLQPFEPLWVGKDRHKPRHDELEKGLL
jgi:hypothetical protein